MNLEPRQTHRADAAQPQAVGRSPGRKGSKTLGVSDTVAQAGVTRSGGVEEREQPTRESQGAMAHVKASDMWEGEQVVSGQEKAGLPPPGKRSEKEHGLWEGRPVTKTGHPSLAGTEGQRGKSNQGEQNSDPIYYQYHGTVWGCVTARRIKPGKAPVARPDP